MSALQDNIRRLELWHMAYELGHDVRECDGIARHPEFLYADTLRRWRRKDVPDAYRFDGAEWTSRALIDYMR